MWTLSVGCQLGQLAITWGRLAIGWGGLGSVRRPNCVTGGVDTVSPYFKSAESVSGLVLAQNQGFGLVLG